MNLRNWRTRLIEGFVLQSDNNSPDRYRVLRRNIVMLMILVTVIPLIIMAVIYQYEYQSSIKKEIITPLQTLANKTKHSFELFLEERLSVVKFIAASYSFEELSDQKTLSRIFQALMDEYCCLIDLGLINTKGIQLSYIGPYEFMGKNYSKQSWFQEVMVKGDYISDVFMGYRQFPHVAIAALRRTEESGFLVLRATIDTRKFDNIIASMELDPESDAFLISREGILQTPSRFYGKILDHYPVSFPRGNYGSIVVEEVDSQGREMLIAYAPFTRSDYILVLVKQRSAVLKPWYTLRTKMLFIFVISVVTIILVVFKLTDTVLKRVKEADEKRELAYREIQHTHKLSSIGRLAAGVAHEINNPLAIINEKAGLIKDLIEYTPNFEQKEKFSKLVKSVIESVKRCKAITHRLLGFAKRMEVEVETLDLNELIVEVLGFMEKEALYRNIDISLQLAKDLSMIDSDRGQLQQVFLNIFNNAMAALEDEGRIAITTWEKDPDTVAASIEDNGCGMSEETCRHIFEPFFTSKKEQGTGLGLSITYGIVKKLGGDIEVESKENQGTKFTVYLPKKSK
jgi:two-component system NtrC family sensor kinase